MEAQKATTDEAKDQIKQAIDSAMVQSDMDNEELAELLRDEADIVDPN